MNTKIDIAPTPFFGLSPNMGIISLQKVCTNTGRSVLGIAKFLLMSAPFLALAVMLLALWGVAGKTTYADIEADRQGSSLANETATNFPVSEIKTIEPCGQDGTSSDSDSKYGPSFPAKIDWEHIV